MKRFLYVFAVFVIVLFIPQTVYAEDADAYQEQLKQYDFSFMEELDEDTYDLLEELGITNFDYNTLVHFSFSDFFKTIKDMLKGAVQTPIEACIAIFVFIIISSFFQNLKTTMINDEMSSVFSTVSALVIAVVLAIKMKTTISLACTAISVCADFVFAFIPVFCIIVAASGNTVAAFSTNTMLLSLAQILNYVSKNVFVPLTNCFLAIGICSGLRSELNLNSLLAFLKKYITTFISVAAAGFVSVLSIKTAVAARADAIGLRSIRFAINSVVPVIGSAISEGLLSIQSYS
ncbi:MAG: hypothetical protein K2I73_04880, partial [Eubacterium sp.]|nr:hypothetical protein [Eubacterium sp.]